MPFPTEKILCILYSAGGTADVGRHAVRAALDANAQSLNVRVLTKDPRTLLDETNWKCACDPHSFSKEELQRLDVRAVDVTKDDLQPHLDDNVGGVISALGNRQPMYGNRVGAKGTRNLVKAMEAAKIERLVAITSMGLSEDWPPGEFHWAGNILKWIFLLSGSHRDLQGAEDAIISSSTSLDYLLVRPVGLGEDRRPKGEWFVQKEKYKDKLGPDMSKMDCASFAVQEVLEPTYSRRGVVIGSNWDTFELDEPKRTEL
eukprot:CAMPEP_0119014904 /NCGR_PEP_ID=MMETSP1176-20130426/10449_1 /TAXON_ID=265551 /ORGANISM="Synedropsis recta cf, Strain CCMP1620" /LENGTH=258 /DNA_ID=CAMNT_0006968151 /DNA_START=110 /DNA_END=886 /DNA_ORIENTATION=-